MKTIFVLLFATVSLAQTVDLDNIRLGGAHSAEPQYFHMQSHYIKYAQNGDLSNQEFYNIVLACEPGDNGDTYTCLQFRMTLEDVEYDIPALKNWTYLFNPGPEGMGENGQVLGIPHEKFEGLTTADEQEIDTEHQYAIYNSFVDFHSFNDVFTASMGDGSGIEDLHNIDDRIIHDAAYSEPPVNLGDNIKEGSVFRNGKVTMTLKGLSRINNKNCALVGFDSGESSFTMKIEAMPNMIVDTNGSSHYFGDLYIDVDSFWLQRAQMAEFVVSETKIPSMNMSIPGTVERRVRIDNISKKEFENLLTD